jgi:hypothetical protein
LSNRSRQTFLKRQKELQRQERQRIKGEKRAQRRASEKEKPQLVGGEDPDILGIVPGPQPLPWEIEEEEAVEEATEETKEETSSPE